MLLQLKDVVRLVAWKYCQGQGHSQGHDQGQGQERLIAASCHQKEFDSLLTSFMAGATLRHDNFDVALFTSKFDDGTV